MVPTIGVLLYLLILPNSYTSRQKTALLALIFITTYLVPILILELFKKFNLINNFNINGVKERKVPVALMIIVFYLLGNTIANNIKMMDISLLFYASSIALTFVYLCLAYQLKISIHLLSLGLSTGFFILIGFIYNYSFPIVVIGNILLAGIVANGRLHLKIHRPKEVYLGFLSGLIAPFVVYNFL
tara:strand:+ start:67 stop:624 length:558 start_codon:yes stop_codon:yes gene_type:complete